MISFVNVYDCGEYGRGRGDGYQSFLDERHREMCEDFEERHVRDADYFVLLLLEGFLCHEVEFGVMGDLPKNKLEEERREKNRKKKVYLERDGHRVEILFEDHLKGLETVKMVLEEERRIRVFGQLKLDNIFYVDHFEYFHGNHLVGCDIDLKNSKMTGECSLYQVESLLKINPNKLYLVVLCENNFYEADALKQIRLAAFLSCRFEFVPMKPILKGCVLLVMGMHTRNRLKYMVNNCVGSWFDPLHRLLEDLAEEDLYSRICLVPTVHSDNLFSPPEVSNRSNSKIKNPKAVLLHSSCEIRIGGINLFVSSEFSSEKHDFCIHVSNYTQMTYKMMRKLFVRPGSLCLVEIGNGLEGLVDGEIYSISY